METPLALTDIVITTVETAETKDRRVPVSVLRAIASAKRTIAAAARKTVLVSLLCGCIVLNIHWGGAGFLFLALPYAKIVEALFD